MAELSELELDVLRKVRWPDLAGMGMDGVYAFAVWNGRDGIEMGPVRWHYEEDGKYRYSCSPFPGAWTIVPEKDILRVRHVGALGIPVA